MVLSSPVGELDFDTLLDLEAAKRHEARDFEIFGGGDDLGGNAIKLSIPSLMPPPSHSHSLKRFA